MLVKYMKLLFVWTLFATGSLLAAAQTVPKIGAWPGCNVNFTPLNTSVDVRCEPECAESLNKLDDIASELRSLEREIVTLVTIIKANCTPPAYECFSGGPKLNKEEAMAVAEGESGGKCYGGERKNYIAAYVNPGKLGDTGTRERIINNANSFKSPEQLIQQVSDTLRRPIDTQGVCFDCLDDLFIMQHSNESIGIAIGDVSVGSDVLSRNGFRTNTVEGDRLNRFFTRLKPLMCSGATITIAQCNSATSDSNKELAQHLADTTGLTINAPDGAVCSGPFGVDVRDSYFDWDSIRGFTRYIPKVPKAGKCDALYRSNYKVLAALQSERLKRLPSLIKKYQAQHAVFLQARYAYYNCLAKMCPESELETDMSTIEREGKSKEDQPL